MDWGKGRENENVVEDSGEGGGGFGGGAGLRFGGFTSGWAASSHCRGQSVVGQESSADSFAAQRRRQRRSDGAAQRRGEQGYAVDRSDQPHRFVRTILGSTEMLDRVFPSA